MKPLSQTDLDYQIKVAREQDFVDFATEISYEDDTATLLTLDKTCPIITTVARDDSNENIFHDSVAYLQHRLKINHGSLDQLVKELNYQDPADFLAVLCDDCTSKQTVIDLIKDIYHKVPLTTPTDFLIKRLRQNDNSLDKLSDELDFYDSASFLEFFTDERPDDDIINDIVYAVYGGENLVDLYQS